MSLIECEECENEVSTKADTCPHCGAPVHEDPVEETDFEARSRMGVQDSKSYLLGLYCAVFVLDFPFFLMLMEMLEAGGASSVMPGGDVLFAYVLTLFLNMIAMFWSVSVLTSFEFDQKSLAIAAVTTICVLFNLTLVAAMVATG